MTTNQPLRSLDAAGVRLALGSDAGGEEANPFLNMMLATMHRLNPREALSREQALLAYTSGGAYAEGQADVRGMIKLGMTADLALLSQDVLAAPIEQLPATESVLTLIGGKIVHEILP
jgi:predicted amidohydrolase YtcJ